MGTCFVIQPFDRGVFDKRYEDVFVPAIESADLEAYRVDRDPSVSIPIEDIESGIRRADVCLAEITTNNPNVWFELGFAIASKKQVVLVCCPKERNSNFPFDVQHRSIIEYSTESTSDFEALKNKLKERLKAILEKEEQMGRVASLPTIKPVEGLEQHEMTALVAVAENIDTAEESVSAYTIRQDMSKAGFTRVAVTLALSELSRKGLIEPGQEHDREGDPYAVYRLLDAGMNWLKTNRELLVLHRPPDPPGKRYYPPPPEDDIPF